ncbi:MAG: bifunctional diaminohydroxyphosphoribosylaminopyrimidine deaminase/5-amino-6-(5-phosphoribosylamino)uracil reductase RibD, partial [Marinirhabdus sp.]
MNIHEKYMHRCIQLAKNGLGSTYPNPLVGSVIVANNTIIGEGWHYKAGLPHAEVNAMAAVRDRGLLAGATLYVNLEPCNHFGKTPPCSQAIVTGGIKNVVVGSTDPNPGVSGGGIKTLAQAGCRVTVGVLETACKQLNKRFFTFQQKKRPYVFLKWAESCDGFIAPKTRDKRAPVWITNEISRQWVHKLRAEEQAILVGTQTVLADNPLLTVRHWEGPAPLRVVLDRDLRIPPSAAVHDGSAPTVVFTETERATGAGTLFKKIDFGKTIVPQILGHLFKMNIQSLIVEGGAKTLQNFIDAAMWDEAFVFKGANNFSEGVRAPKI